MYQFSGLRRRTYPTITQLVDLIARADEPVNPDTRALSATCKQMFTANLRLAGHRLVRKTAVSAFGWSITSADQTDTARVGIATKALASVIAELLQRHANTAFFGTSCMSITWELQDGVWTPMNPTALDPTEVSPNGTAGVKLFDPNSQQLKIAATIESPHETDLYITDNLGEFKVGGTLRAILPTDFIRFEMIRENANFLKKLKGILQVINKGAGEEEKTDAEAAAADAAANNYVATSDLIEFKLNSITNNGSGFKDFIESLNSDISIAVLGQANTSSLPSNGGSRAALQVLKMVSADIHYDDITRIERVINEQVILPYWRRNYERSATSSPLSFAINLFEEQNYEANVTILRETLGAGIPVLKREAYQKIGYQVPPSGTPEEDLLIAPPSQF